VIYGATWEGQPCRLFSTRPESPESSVLSLPDAEILAISSTGQMALSLDRHWAGRFIWSGTLAQVPLLGGAPREILEDHALRAGLAQRGRDLVHRHPRRRGSIDLGCPALGRPRAPARAHARRADDPGHRA
jgi:hypothetical protein